MVCDGDCASTHCHIDAEISIRSWKDCQTDLLRMRESICGPFHRPVVVPPEHDHRPEGRHVVIDAVVLEVT